VPAVPATQRLYYDDAYLLTFTATVVAVREAGDRLHVALDRSAFYPTSGGQAHDLGALTLVGQDDAAAVEDVEADEDGGLVWHVLAASTAPAPWQEGVSVKGCVDGARRADHRQQHTGQHVLSASCASVCKAETRSVHLGADTCTLDLDRELTPQQLADVERDANRIVVENRPVQVRYVDAAEAATLPLRRQTTRTGTVRLVEIEGHDLSACGGTHVSRTGEIGAIVVRGAERFKGGARVTFACGARAIDSHRDATRTLDAVARALSVGAADVPDAVARLLDEAKSLRRTIEAQQARLSEYEAAALEARFSARGALHLLVEHVSAASPADLRRIASSLVTVPARLVVLVGGDAPHALVVARSSSGVDVDVPGVASALAKTFGGKAGGRGDLAQGGGVTCTLEALRAEVDERLSESGHRT